MKNQVTVTWKAVKQSADVMEHCGQSQPEMWILVQVWLLFYSMICHSSWSLQHSKAMTSWKIPWLSRGRFLRETFRAYFLQVRPNKNCANLGSSLRQYSYTSLFEETTFKPGHIHKRVVMLITGEFGSKFALNSNNSETCPLMKYQKRVTDLDRLN